jgi:hypothetical protein
MSRDYIGMGHFNDPEHPELAPAMPPLEVVDTPTTGSAPVPVLFKAKYADGSVDFCTEADGFDPDVAEMRGGVEIVGLCEIGAFATGSAPVYEIRSRDDVGFLSWVKTSKAEYDAHTMEKRIIYAAPASPAASVLTDEQTLKNIRVAVINFWGEESPESRAVIALLQANGATK